MGDRRPAREPALGEDDVEGVEVLEDRALGEDQQVGVAAGPDRGVGAQRAVLGEVLAGGEELAFILRPLLGVAALPRGVELEERELRVRAISSSASFSHRSAVALGLGCAATAAAQDEPASDAG